MAKDKDKIVEEAHKRFARCEDAERDNREAWKRDLRFANADPDNGWQWDESMRKQRELEARPCLTINKVKQHNRQITNEARQNKPAIRVMPVDSGADPKTADILNGLIRHIEANSDADTAYDTAEEFAVDAGLGYWRVTTDYAAEDTFDQEIFIKRVKNPLNVYLDPDIQEADGSDARFGFVFEPMSKEEFENAYPDFDAIDWPLNNGDDWLNKDTIRICEYFKRCEEKDTLYADENGNTMLASKMEPDMLEAAKAMKLRSRPVISQKVKWYLIAGDQILEEKDWLGKYIPIVRVVGDELEIDGKTERKGHTRPMKDAARMYNYWTSSAVEHVALQGKTPWDGPAEAFEGYESYWNTANTANHSYLPWNHTDEAGNPIPRPQRAQPPTMAPAYLQGMQIASEEMKMASGQYDASMGAKSNETSGRAILARQREGDVATFHFVDNVARAIKYTGKILVDLIPKIYDTARVVRILGEDGKEDKVQIDPTMPQAYAKQQDPMTREVQEIYNPSVGRYDVRVSVGPSYSTKRQEAAIALTEMSSRNPQLMGVAGDLIMKAQDFPMADELAKRLEKTIPPEIMKDEEEGESPEVLAAKQQVQELQGQLQALGEEFNKLNDSKETEQAKLLIEQAKLQLEAEKQQIERMKAEAEIQFKAAQLDRPEAVAEPSTDMARAELDAQVKLRLKQMEIEAAEKLEVMRLSASANPAQPADNAQPLVELMERLEQTMRMMAAPKRIVRDETGAAIGVQTVMDEGNGE